jgi:hypothetical protein
VWIGVRLLITDPILGLCDYTLAEVKIGIKAEVEWVDNEMSCVWNLKSDLGHYTPGNLEARRIWGHDLGSLNVAFGQLSSDQLRETVWESSDEDFEDWWDSTGGNGGFFGVYAPSWRRRRLWRRRSERVCNRSGACDISVKGYIHLHCCHFSRS